MTFLKSLWQSLPQLEQWPAAKMSTALFTDIDGTLCDIQADPDKVTVPQAIKTSLAALTKQMPLVAVITGRSTKEAKALLGLKDVYYLGAYGEELLPSSERQRFQEQINKAKAMFAQVVLPLKGISLEEKGLLLTVHWRQCQKESDIKFVQEKLVSLAQELELSFSLGKKIFELKPKQLSKEAAIISLVKKQELKKLIFVGDDLADAQAFQYLTKLREKKLIDCLTIGVLSTETPKLVITNSDYQVCSYKEVKMLFDWLLRGFLSNPSKYRTTC